MKRIRIKMCGTTRTEDAWEAVSCGVDALGFIFAKKSPRYVDPEQAASIIDTLPPFIARVGVFVDSSLDEIKTTVKKSGLTTLQLHGTESPDFCLALKQWDRTLSLYKAFRVGDGCPVVDVSAFSPVIDGVLLDTYIKGVAGGTGKVFDWALIASLKIDRPLILAGGLSPDNIEAALQKVWPFAIDINSGIEKQPGIKDHRLLKELVSKVRKKESERAALA